MTATAPRASRAGSAASRPRRRWSRVHAIAAATLAVGLAHGSAAARSASDVTFALTTQASRFAFVGHLRFLDEDRYLVVTDCRGATPAELHLGRASSGNKPAPVRFLGGCDVFVGDGVIATLVVAHGRQQIERFTLDGRALPSLAVPPTLEVRRILAADRTRVFAEGTTPTADPLQRETAVALLATGVRARVITAPELVSLEHQPSGGAILAADAVVFATEHADSARLYRWALDRGTLAHVDLPHRCTQLVRAPAGSDLVCLREQGNTRTVDVTRITAAGSKVWSTTLSGDHASATADGTRIVSSEAAVIGGDGSTHARADASAHHAETAFPTELAVSPGGTRALVGLADGSVQLWRIAYDPLDARTVQAILRRHTARLAACLANAPATRAPAISFVIGTRGTVTEVTARGMPAATASCVRTELSAIRFPPPATPVSISYPFASDPA